MRNGFLMKEVFADGEWRIYERFNKQSGKSAYGWELIKVRVANIDPNSIMEKGLAEKGYTAKEKYPSDVDFGNYAWDFVRLEDAMEFYRKKKQESNN